MTRIFSWIQNVILRRIMIVFLLGLAFLGMQTFAYSNGMQAQAETVKTPEGIYYKGTPDNSGNVSNDKNLLDKALDKLNPNADNNLRRNFNDDREYYDNTANQGKIGETVRTPEGIYYKGTPENNLIESSKNKLREGADNIREKLNLD
ncbi:MAG: hypothetical protein RMX68_021455 [Aulosira sp. ZfuVER01]|nr:hypothetical protein [Aulosira sp. ZfuVER01]MDZ8002693.1 hypothetical protein [Aulosira sp. DedVER01a]MDZ8050629.1 hypothetical protein [Aulosira sp. ZfuCHP01]